MAGRGARRARPAARAPDRYFLRSPSLAAAIVRDVCIDRGDLVLDLGAGSGRLTEPLAACARDVRAIELDPLLAERLRERFRGRSSVTIVEGDVLSGPFPREPFRAVGNVGCTTAILRRLLDDPRVPLVRADLVLGGGSPASGRGSGRARSSASTGARGTSST